MTMLSLDNVGVRSLDEIVVNVLGGGEPCRGEQHVCWHRWACLVAGAGEREEVMEGEDKTQTESEKRKANHLTREVGIHFQIGLF
jgi:hypothetical protein